jgi:hypothetical protein
MFASRCSGRLVLAAVVVLTVFAGLAAAASVSLSWSGPIRLDQTTGVSLAGVACPSASQCTAIDDAGQQVTFDPAAAATPTPTSIDITGDGYLEAVACPSASQCTAVDSAGQEVTFDPKAPGKPTPTLIDSGNYLLGVACPSVRQCTAADYNGREVTFDPEAPGNPTTPILVERTTGYLDGVACPSVSQCTAVADAGQEVTFDPKAPGAPTATTVESGHGADNELFGVACPSVSQCTAVDYTGHQVTFDPKAPTTPTTTTIDGTNILHAVACPSVSQCTAVDGTGHQVTFDPEAPGSPTPALIDRGYEDQLTAVACPSVSECVAVNNHGDGFVGRMPPSARAHLQTGHFAVHGSAAELTVSCIAARCQGTIVATVSVRAKHHKDITDTVATEHFSIAAGATATLKVTLNHEGRTLLARDRQIRTTVVVSLGSGKHATKILTSRLTLKTPRRTSKP